MKILLLAALIVALTAIHLAEEDLPANFVAPSAKCLSYLNIDIGNDDGTLVRGDRNFEGTCSELEIEEGLF
jgi:hypothetical protein